MIRFAALCIAISVGFVGCDEPIAKVGKEAGPTPPPKPVVVDAGADETLFVLAPQPQQLAEEPMLSVEFITWSKDGNHYVVDSKRGSDGGELSGRRYLELREVRDARSGEMVASFRIEKAIDADVGDSTALLAAWQQAQPMKAYKPFSVAQQLGAEGAVPEGWKLEVKAGDAPAMSKAVAKSAGLTTTLEWRSWQKPRSAAEKAYAKKRPLADEETARATFKVTLASSERVRLVWQPKTEATQALIREATNNPRATTIIRGRLATHWAPGGKRFAQTINWSSEGLNPEMAGPSATTKILTVGPQVSLVVSSDERRRAAGLVRAIEADGLAVTSVGFSTFSGPATASVNYSDTRDRKWAAILAARVLGTPSAPAKPNPSVGWDLSAILAPRSAK